MRFQQVQCITSTEGNIWNSLIVDVVDSDKIVAVSVQSSILGAVLEGLDFEALYN